MSLQPSDLLHYNAIHRVLICKDCNYAIQPSAVMRHLKELHQIYHAQRKDFLDFTRDLDLAEPGHVVLPLAHKPSIPHLPIEDGQVCGFPGCGHLCMTVKRMKNHWFKEHHGVEGVTWAAVKLQTFFRGNQLKYFVVTPELPVQEEAQDYWRIHIQEDLTLNEGNWTTHELYLLHHFQTHTSLTLGCSPETELLWQTIVPQLSRNTPFLKHGILAISAIHLAEVDSPKKSDHYRLSVQYQNLTLPDYQEAISTPSVQNCHSLLAFSQLAIIYSSILEVRKHDGENLARWLRQVRDSYNILKPVWQHLEQGPLSDLIPEGLQGANDTPAFLKPSITERVDSLRQLIFSGPKPLSKLVLLDIPLAFPAAHMELARAFQISKVAQTKSHYTLWTAVCVWPARVSEHFLERLEANDSSALILLAYFLASMKPLRGEWYMRGFVEDMLSRIVGVIDNEFKGWLEWPLEEAGISESLVSLDVMEFMCD